MIKEVCLGDIASFTQGQQVSISDQKTEMFDNSDVFLRIINYTQNSNDFRYINKQDKKYHITKNDIIMVRYGAVGFVGRGLEGVLANNMFKISYDENIVNSSYLYRVLWSENIQNQILNGAQSTSMAAINFASVSRVKIPLPALPQQQKIANILDAADALRQNDKALIAKYDELTQALFLDMFGDPVSNPKGWEKVELKKLLMNVSKIGRDFRVKNIQYIDISSIDNSKSLITSTTNYLLEDRPSRAQQILKKGDVLLATVRPNLKNIAINNVDGFIASTGFYVCRCNNKINNRFLFEVLKSDSVTNYFVGITSGANYPAIKSSDVSKLLISLPPFEFQNQFVERVAVIEEQKAIAQKSLEKSEELFNSLLQMAFKGELA